MVSAAAARALANFRDERTVHPLIAQASHQGEAGEGAIWALGELRNEGSVPTLVRVLEDRSSTNRTTAAEALGKIGGVTAMRALAKYFWHPPAVWDKETGLTVVQRYGDSNIVLPLIQFWGKSEGCVDAKRILVAILRRYAQSSTVDVLHAAAAFADQPYTDFRSVVDERYGSNIYKEEILDLGEVRRLAKEELDRRGLST
jgi:HEAT repeat protein